MMVATSPYLDDRRQPRMRESMTAFLDVLGFSHTVLDAAEKGQSQQCLDSLVATLNRARVAVRSAMSQVMPADGARWAVKLFSDNLLFGYPCDEKESAAEAAVFVLGCVQHYQLHMAIGGFFVRGAVALGPLCVTDEIIFGTALIEAYQLEAKASIVPRVIVTEKLMSIVTRQPEGAARSQAPAAEDLVCRDIDNWWFVNYLQAAVEPGGVNWNLVEQHKSSVLASLSRSPRHDILPKFGWVSRYHNVFCHWHRNDPGYLDQFRIKRVDEESAIERLTSQRQ